MESHICRSANPGFCRPVGDVCKQDFDHGNSVGKNVPHYRQKRGNKSGHQGIRWRSQNLNQEPFSCARGTEMKAIAKRRLLAVSALVVTWALVAAIAWRHGVTQQPETFRGAVHHPTLTPSEQADRLVEQIEFLRSKGIEPVREDFDIGQGWKAPSDWTGPPDWDSPEWRP